MTQPMLPYSRNIPLVFPKAGFARRVVRVMSPGAYDLIRDRARIPMSGEIQNLKHEKYTRWALMALIGMLTFVAPWNSYGVSLDLGGELTGQSLRIIQLLVVLTILSLAPSILVMVTSFTRLIVVFSFLRNALGLQQSPPNAVLISLALFMTFFIMSPAAEQAYREGVQPYTEGKMSEEVAWQKTTAPFHGFMRKFTREQDLQLFLSLSHKPVPERAEDVSLTTLIFHGPVINLRL